MKTTYFFILFSLTSIFSFSQVGINTTSPDPSSMLDVSATNKGVLFPRVALSGTSDITTIPSPAVGLLVYNTASAGGLTPGYRYWDGLGWTAMGGNGGTGGGGGSSTTWALNGNNIVGDEFLGTTNYTSLRLKVNNETFGLLHPNGGIAFGKNAVANQENAIAIGTGANASANIQATAVGPFAIASGYQATALGYNAKAITSNSTLALGNSATASSFQATAIGVNANANTNNNTLAIGTNSVATGENSSAIGTSSRATGQNAIAIGTNSFSSALNSSALGNNSNAGAQNATAVGYGAVANNPNTLILGNDLNISDWSATKVGIGTNNPTEKLEVRGNIKIVEGSLKMQNGSLQLADGSQGAGKVLTSDANGNATWQSASSSANLSFADVYSTASQSLQALSDTAINFGSSSENINMNVNSNNIQVTKSGRYKITYAVTVHKNGGSDTNVKFKLTRGWNSNMVPGSASYAFIGNGDKVTATATRIVHLNAWEQIYVFADSLNGDNTISTVADGTYLTVELL